LIQVSPQNYYYYKRNNLDSTTNTSSNSLLGGTNQNGLKSPQDENGYLIPITIIEYNNNDSQKNSNDNLKAINKNLENIRRQSSMKVESRSSKKKVLF
jgi:hypothetical protein